MNLKTTNSNKFYTLNNNATNNNYRFKLQKELRSEGRFHIVGPERGDLL